MSDKKMTIEELTQYRIDNPWVLTQKGFKVIENIYYVGNSWVSAFLLDTEKGLVLIDCAMQETLYLLIDNIRAVGFDPHDIKYLLLTHGHFDHVGAARAIQEMSGCETYIGEGDAFFFTERRDLIAFEETVPEFKIDHYYDYDHILDFGNIKIKPVHCPGHTPGTTSMFFEIVHKGKTLKCGMHGGLGAVVLSRENLEKSHLDVEKTRATYLESLDKIMDMEVDVVIPSHVGHLVDHDFFKIAEADDGTGEGFIDSSVWKRMISAKKAEMLALIEKENQ